MRKEKKKKIKYNQSELEIGSSPALAQPGISERADMMAVGLVCGRASPDWGSTRSKAKLLWYGKAFPSVKRDSWESFPHLVLWLSSHNIINSTLQP